MEDILYRVHYTGHSIIEGALWRTFSIEYTIQGTL